MECHPRHLYGIDELSFPTFLGLIKPFIFDPVRYERLSQGFPAPRAVTQRLVTKSPGYRKPSSPPAQTIPRPRTQARVVLQRIEVLSRKHSPSPVSPLP